MSKSIESSAFSAWRNKSEKSWRCPNCKQMGIGERQFCGCGADLHKPPKEELAEEKVLEHA